MEDLPKISINEILNMQEKINEKKAITLSGFSLKFIKNCKQFEILNDWWRKDCILQLYN